MTKANSAICVVIATILIAPMVVYIWHFGWQISRDHARWSEFGSAMSGIYTPILSLLTLAVLALQTKIQKQLHDHETTQAYVEQARADIEFYVGRLAATMSIPLSHGNAVRAFLHAAFEHPSVSDLDSDLLRGLARELDTAVPQVLGLLFAVYPILVGLSSSQEAQYRLNYTSAIQKLTSILSFETCVALENFHRTRTEGHVGVPYAFSPLLRAR